MITLPQEEVEEDQSRLITRSPQFQETLAETQARIRALIVEQD